MNTIIVATDYSATADNALRFAASLASDINANLVLFNAYKLPVAAANSLTSPSGYDVFFSVNEIRLERLARKTSEAYKIEVKWFTSSSIVTAELDELVKRVNADLVVVGMHENDWLNKFGGNTATSVIRNADYPVLVIPEHVRYNCIDQILFAYDYDCIYNNKLSLLKEIAGKFNAQIHVYHIETQVPVEADVAGLYVTAESELALSEVKHSFTDVFEDDVIEGINRGLKEFAADMLVMVPHKFGFWKGLSHKSKTRRMALCTNVPLLLLPNPF